MKDYASNFIKCLEGLDYTKRTFDIFQDFLKVSSISLSSIILREKDSENEYFNILNRYKHPEKLAELLTITLLVLEEKHQDFLGAVYMKTNSGNKRNGQFFTHYHVSQFMTEITFEKDAMQEIIDKEGFVKVSEPCCGACGMIIAFAETMLKYGINPQKYMVFQAIDIDINCCYMTFIQTSLLGLTGEIIHGNTLSLEAWNRFITPMTVLNLRNYRKFKNPDKMSA